MPCNSVHPVETNCCCGWEQLKPRRDGRFSSSTLQLPKPDETVTRQTFTFRLDKPKLQQAELRDGHYLLRTNLTADNPEQLWKLYMQLTQIEAAFRCLKTDLKIRPIHHQLEQRVDAHILVAFLSLLLDGDTEEAAGTARSRSDARRRSLEKLASIQMIDVCIPTTQGCLAGAAPLHPTQSGSAPVTEETESGTTPATAAPH